MAVVTGMPSDPERWLEELSLNFDLYRERLIQGLCRKFRSFRLKRHEAEIIADTALTKARANIAKYNPNSRPLYVWVHIIATRCAWDHIRSAERRRATVSTDDVGMEDRIATAGPVEAYAWKKLTELLDTLLAALPQEQREALRLRYGVRLSHEEAAATMGVSVRRYQQLLSEGRGSLGRVRELKERYGDCDFLRKEVYPRKGRNRGDA